MFGFFKILVRFVSLILGVEDGKSFPAPLAQEKERELFVKKQEIVDDGQIAVVLIEEEATVKRVFYDRESDILTLMPENPTYRPMRYQGAQLDQIRILGRVVAVQYEVR
jgi:SOS-response transcriptional repressor LexA